MNYCSLCKTQVKDIRKHKKTKAHMEKEYGGLDESFSSVVDFCNDHQMLVDYLEFFESYRKCVNCNVYIRTKYVHRIRCDKCNVLKNTCHRVHWLDPNVQTEDDHKAEYYDKYSK